MKSKQTILTSSCFGFCIHRELKALQDSATKLSAQEKILLASRRQADFYAQDVALRDAFLLDIEKEKRSEEGSIGNGETQNTARKDGDEVQVVSIILAKVVVDHSLEGLDKIHELRMRGGGTHVVMPNIVKLPKYNAWVPVMRNFFVTEPDIDVFIPWFGERKGLLEKAAEVHEQMRDDSEFRSPFNEPSDGEINEVGELQERKTLEFYALSSILNRESMRHVLVTITKKYGKALTVWVALSEALGIADIRRLQYMCDLAERRDAELERKSEMRRKAVQHAQVIRQAIYRPLFNVAQQTGREGHATHPLRHFCFFCHEFACHYHKGENVAPLVPIPDRKAEWRSHYFEKLNPKLDPCSQTCYLLRSWVQSPALPEEGEAWSSEEVSLLDEAVTIFLKDPCGLSVVIGSKTCREVDRRLREPSELNRVEVLIRQTQKRRDMSTAGEGKNGNLNSDDGGDVPPVKKKRGRRRRYQQRIKSICQVSKNTSSGPIEEERYIPCNHTGSCLKKNSCGCAMRGHSCESLCGCNSGRFVQGEEGMLWQGPTDEDVARRVAVRCKERWYGCSCESGFCVTDDCECYANRRVCNPDFCNDCGCCWLPSEIGFRKRRCRNSDMITGRHKKTFIGRSTVHGYGLFAGEHFSRGDLVGPYNGRLMSSDLMDQALRISQAQKETFAFDAFKDMAIDGGVMGSKMKFINHQETGTNNCIARPERFRGEIRIALKVARAVEPGEEFFFNYAIIDEGGNGNQWLLGEDEGSHDSENVEETESGEIVEERVSGGRVEEVGDLSDTTDEVDLTFL